MIFYELVTLGINELGAFATNRFGNEKGAGLGTVGAGVVEAGGVELDELHVRDGGSGTPGHGESVPGRGIGIGGIKVSFPTTTGGQYNAVGAVDFDFTGLPY